MKSRFIHIGYPKTGTSTLQSSVFPDHPEINYLGAPFLSPSLRENIFIDILLKDSLGYNPQTTKDKFLPYLKKTESDPNFKVTGISYEEFSFSFDGTHTDRGLVAKRLKNILGDAKIIILVRNQLDFIRSFYSETIKGGCFFSFEDFLQAHYWRFYTYFFHQLFYHKMIQCYQDLFGNDRVKVELFENFKDKPKEVINDILSFVGVSSLTGIEVGHENSGLSTISLEILRIMNRLFKNSWGRSYFQPVPAGALTPGMDEHLSFIPKGLDKRESLRRYMRSRFNFLDNRFNLKPMKIKFSPEWKQKIEVLYKDDNRKLAEVTGLNLEKYNYPL